MNDRVQSSRAIFVSKVRTNRVLLFYVVFMIYFAAHLMGSGQQLDPKEQTDHLVPVVSHIEPAYMQLLSRRLFLSAANYGRILVMPSTNEGEYAISIYSQPTRKGRNETAVTCTRAEKNLWYSMFQSQQTKASTPTVPVRRTDTPIPKSTALALSKAIKQMIVRSRSSQSWPRGLGWNGHTVLRRWRSGASGRLTRPVRSRPTHQSSA